MPVIKSSKKALKQSIKNQKRNNFFKWVYSEVRRKFEKAIRNNDLETAKSLFYNKKEDWKNVKSWLQSIIDKLAKKNIIHKNNANRKKSKFAAMLKNLETSK